MPVDPSQLYSPGDFTATRKRIFEDSLDAVKKRFPIENTRYTLSLENVNYDAPHDFSLKEQKRAVQNDQSLSWKIKGNWVLTDKATGQVVSKSSRRTIMDIPYLTERGTFIRNGTEMTLPMQMRLVPGVYSRMGEDGMAKAHINARPGTGNTVMMNLNPAKPIFRVSVGTRNYDLFPLLKHNGISDDEIKAAWGDELFKINQDAFVNGGGWYKAKTAADNPDPNDPWEKASKDVFGGELDADNTTSAFGTAYTKVDPRLLLATSSRLIGLAKGTSVGDNRDSMENQRFFGPSDYIAERIRLDAGGLARNLLWRVSRYGDAEKIPSSPLSKYVHGLFTESNLSQAIEETNLLDAYKRATMVTRMGEGGIGSLESAPMSARLVHNTYKGFICPISSPECTSDKHLVFTELGWKPIAEITENDLVACMIDGRLEYHHPEKVVSYDFDGQLYCHCNKAVKYEVTGNHRMWCRRIPQKQKVKKRGGIQKAYNPEWGFEFAEDMYNCTRQIQPGGHLPFIHKVIEKKELISDEDCYVFDMKDWCALLGWYISEGNVTHNDHLRRAVMITQVEKVNKQNCAEIVDLLTKMKIPFRFDGTRFAIKSRALWTEFKPLGYCDDKYIPEEVFSASEEAQRAFIDTLLKGDGRKEGNNMPVLCTTSKRLADDYEKLLFNLGYPVSIKFEKDERLPQYLGCYTVRALKGENIWLWKNGHKLKYNEGRSQYYYRENYKGKVYCLTVPGGLFYTKIEGYHGFWIGNSLRVGLDTQIAHSAKRGKDGLVYSPVINAKTGKKEYISSLESSRAAVSFPEYRDSKDMLIPAMVGNEIKYLPKSDVQYFIPSGDNLFSTAADFVPIKSGIKAGRLLMAQKHQTQAMSIKDRMAPYVQSLDPDGSGKSMEEVNSHIMGAVKAGLGGKVVRVTKDDITVLQSDGTRRSYSLYNNYPLNRKSVVNNTAKVKVGDTVQPGQLLASSSYTDENGVSALGTQLRSGWLSYKGWNYLDAIVVSESAAKKMTSEHFYHEGVDHEDGTEIGRDKYVAAFPSKFNRDQLATIDANGAVKPGTIVKKGDPLVLATSLRPGGPGTGYRALHKDVSSVWDHEFEGEVTDVVEGKDGMRVYVKAWVPLQVGDKMATRFANKGTCAAVIPDEKMPRGADGRPLEILFSPTGIVSRVNSSALIEAALGKVAEKTGKRFVLPGFGTDLIEFAKKELAEAGLSDREDVTDPDTGRVIKGVFTGNSYVTKFHHTSESKGGARSTGSYTADEQPASGGHDGAKTLGGLVLGAFAGHGASEVLKDMKLIKGQKNTDFWRDFKMGKTPNMPGTPLIYKKFLAALEASGVHVTRKGDNTNIFAMTNKDVSNLARTEINSAATYDDKKFLPIKGGLFDPDIFGQEGDQWAKMKLDEPILNPIMDDVVCNFLNLKKADLDAVLSGSMKLPNGETGGEGLRKQLASLNLNTMIENAKHAIRSGPPSKRDKAVKTLRWASAMQSHDVTPDQFMLDEVPVLPPRYRRITRSGDLNMIADANFLYKELLDARDDLRKAKEAGLPDELLAYGRKRISDSFKAVTGLAEPQDRKLQESGVNGLLKWVFGKGSPKCHDDNTEVLTENGWVSFKDYKNKSVKVATLNPITMAIEYQSPTDIIHEPYKGEMIEISNKEIDMCVTHNHNVLLKDSREWSTHRAFALLLRSDATYTFLGFDNTDLMKEVTVWYTDIKAVPYDGYVHCVTVPNGLIVTRRNGKASIGGNSGGLQRLVIGGKLDVAGRSVINVDPRLNLDEIGMPEKQAWGLYRDFVIRKLVQNGMSPLQATKSAIEHAPIAKEALLKVLDERPVIATRAPALHKFSVQAFRPVLVPGDVLKLNSVTEGGYGADFDGNCVDYDTEIYLMSSLDNSFSAAILNDVQVRSTCEVNIGVIKMITKENSIILKSEPKNQLYFFGKIGELPLEGTPVKDINGADVYTLPEGVKVWSFNPTDSSFGWYDATKITVEKDCEVCKLTVGGESVIISTNESVAVFDEETGNLKKVTPSDSIGKIIPICKSLPSVSEGSVKDDVEKGWLHGMMLGDGWLSDSYVGFTKLEDAKRRAFLDGIKKHVTSTPRYHEYAGTRSANKYANSCKLHFTDPAVVAWATELELYNWERDVREDRVDRAALHKEISMSFILGASDDYLWGLVSGLIDSDGTVTKAVKKGTGKVVYGVSISTCSPFLKDSLIALFHRLSVKVGVTQSVHAAKGDRKVESVEYVVMPSASDIQKYLDKLNVVGKLESERIEDWKTQETYKDDRDIIPLSKAEVDMLKVFFPHTEFPAFYASYMKGRISRQNLIKYMSCVEDEDENLAKLKLRAEATGVFWRAVDSVEVLDKRTVYDLEVPETKVFVVNNGPVIWDTMTYYVPVSDKAVKEAYKLMTPSANQLSARDFTSMPQLQEELVAGAYLSSRKKKTPPKAIFNTVVEAKQAYREGKIDVDDSIIIRELQK